MAETLKLEIVTPQAIVFSDDVHMVTLPAIEGEMGIYPQHERLITQVVPGEILVTKDGADTVLAVGGGLVEVTATHVSILTDMAIRAEHIDEAKVQEARDRAEARLREKSRTGDRLRERLDGSGAGTASSQASPSDADLSRQLPVTSYQLPVPSLQLLVTCD